MLKATLVCLGMLYIATLAPASAEPAPAKGGTADSQFIGIDLDNGDTYYNGRNSGVYCLYRTVRVYNTRTGYYEWRRVRRCGRGLYF